MEDKSKQVDRQLLYEEVWSDPVTVVAKRYGLSDVGLAKICRKLAIPLPSRGYWAKVKSGRTMGKAPLPELTSPKTSFIRLVKPTQETLTANQIAKEKAMLTREKIGKVSVPSELTDPHPLVRATMKRLKQRDGWANEKGLRSAPSEVLNLEVTPTALDRALLIADTLIKEFAKQGVTTKIDSLKNATFFDVEGTLVSFALTEYVRRSNHQETPAETKALEQYRNRSNWNSPLQYPSIPRFDYQATGILTITAGKWPTKSWKDTERTPLESRLEEVIAGCFTLASEIRAKDAEEKRRQEELQRAKDQYAFLEKRYEDELSRFRSLESDCEGWNQANLLRTYINAVERHALDNAGLTPEITAWLEWARAKADWLDPLVLVCDHILDAPKPRKPSYW